MAFKHNFEPATTKEGLSIGVFEGYELLSGQTPVTDRKTDKPVLDELGAPVTRKWEIVTLVFNVKGRIQGHTRPIKLTTNGQFGSTGDLEVALKAMGWVNDLVSVEVDEDGLEIENRGDIAVDEDGLEVVTQDIDALTFESFHKFVEQVKGQKFWLKVSKDAKGYLRIEPGTVSPKG